MWKIVHPWDLACAGPVVPISHAMGPSCQGREKREKKKKKARRKKERERERERQRGKRKREKEREREKGKRESEREREREKEEMGGRGICKNDKKQKKKEGGRAKHAPSVEYISVYRGKEDIIQRPLAAKPVWFSSKVIESEGKGGGGRGRGRGEGARARCEERKFMTRTT